VLENQGNLFSFSHSFLLSVLKPLKDIDWLGRGITEELGQNVGASVMLC